MSDSRQIDIHVPLLTRVEGEGALELSIRDGAISSLALRIFEPPRLFEKFLEGRGHDEVPDIVARICGICPVAYQMSATHALESIFQTAPGPWVRAMRRLFYCGEWLESHALHVHLLALPDFLGFESAVAMAEKYPDEVRRGMRLQGFGNALLRAFGARSVHPLGVKVGGFYKAPDKALMDGLLAEARELLPQAEAMCRQLAKLELPDDHQAFVSIAMRHEDEYPFNEGRLVSSDGLDIGIADYEEYFAEYHCEYSTALHSLYYPKGDARVGGEGKPYLVGPLARLNLNHDKLPEQTQALLAECGIAFPSDNMFHSAFARAIECHYALIETITLLENYDETAEPSVEAAPSAGVGYGCSEAPRGFLWHRYETDGGGRILNARIVPPTSQNQARIEEDLAASLRNFGLDQAPEAIKLHAEMVIRNYDPCISCATHFLQLKLDRDE